MSFNSYVHVDLSENNDKAHTYGRTRGLPLATPGSAPAERVHVVSTFAGSNQLSFHESRTAEYLLVFSLLPSKRQEKPAHRGNQVPRTLQDYTCVGHAHLLHIFYLWLWSFYLHQNYINKGGTCQAP